MPPPMAEMVEIIKVAFITQSLVFTEQIHAEAHGLRRRLVTTAQALPIVAVAIKPPSGYLGLHTGFRTVIVVKTAKLVVPHSPDLLIGHIQCRRGASRQARNGQKNEKMAHGQYIVPL